MHLQAINKCLQLADMGITVWHFAAFPPFDGIWGLEFKKNHRRKVAEPLKSLQMGTIEA